MVTNPKIEHKKSDIARTEERLAAVKKKLREQKLELISLENEEIVAMFRKEVITEDDFAALLRSRREAENEIVNVPLEPRITKIKDGKEETDSELIEN